MTEKTKPAELPAFPRRANRILIVEDDRNLSRIMTHQLERHGYETCVAENGYDAGYLTLDFAPHLIFLDIMLPGIDGIEVCRRLRKDESTRDIKIVGMSAFGDQAMTQKLRDVGADDFLSKPFELKQLPVVIEKHIGPIHPDTSVLSRYQLLLYARDEAWGATAEAALKETGVSVARAHSLHEAGAETARLRPHVFVLQGLRADELRPLSKRLRAARGAVPTSVAAVIEEASEATTRAWKEAGADLVFSRSSKGTQWCEQVARAALQAELSRKTSASRALPAPQTVGAWLPLFLVAAAALLVAFFLIWSALQEKTSPGTSGLPEGIAGDIERWKELERFARQNNLVFYENSWVNRDQFGQEARIRLTSGEQLVGFVKRGAGWIEVQSVTREGRFRRRFEPAQVEAIEQPAEVPYACYWEKARELTGKGAEEHLALARWCQQQGLLLPAEREYRRALIADPENEEALEALSP